MSCDITSGNIDSSRFRDALAKLPIKLTSNNYFMIDSQVSTVNVIHTSTAAISVIDKPVR